LRVAERTDEDREAARQERERRRAAQSAGSWSPRAEPIPDGERAPEAPTPPAAVESPVPPPPAERISRADADPPRGGAGPPRRDRRRQGGPRRPHASSGHRHALRRGLAVAVLLLAVVVLWFVVELFQPFHGDGHGSVVVRVPRGASSSQVGDILAREGVIASSFFFEVRATLAGDRGSIDAGSYRLPVDTTYSNALKILTSAPMKPRVTYVTITEGLSRRQVSDLLHDQHVRGSFMAATRGSRLLHPSSYGAPHNVASLEGFLFPDTYQVFSPLRIGQLVDDQLHTFKHEFATVNLRYARAHRLTPYDVLIIASLVQGEAATKHDMALVAAVIYNRLRLGMDLGLDSTTRYATGNYSKPLTVSQLNSSSAWNTRDHPGLPPTPISSPGLTAIDAAAHPARSDALYFVVKPCGNGEMTFTSSYDRFLADSAAYQTARARHGGNSPEFCRSKSR
jgi:UPF0755 protein